MTRIIEKVWSKESKEGRSPPNIQIAFTIAVSESLLNLEVSNIQLNERIMNPRIKYYLKNLVGLSFAK
jgi:hypothetical protein